MSKRLQPMMFEQDFKQVVAESAPSDFIAITIESRDVEKAIEFWLNNVLLRHPVKVEYVAAQRSGALRITCSPVKCEPKKEGEP